MSVRAIRAGCAVLLICTLYACGGGGSSAPTAPPTVTASALYTISGAVTGLDAGATVGLSNNGADQISVSGNGGFTFPTKMSSGFGYSVVVSAQPSRQICNVSNGSGVVGSTSVSNIAVTCSDNLPAETPTARAGDANAVSLYLDGGRPLNTGRYSPNGIYASVLVCSPGGAQCAIIDHVLVDTGSIGLRLYASAINGANPNLLAAMPQTSTSAGTVTGDCTAFGTGTTWGGVRNADLHWGGANYTGETANDIPIQVISDTDPRLSTIPSSCSNQGVPMATVQSLDANGIIGVGLRAQDCGPACASYAYASYYQCDGTGCNPVMMPVSQQIPNPVSALAGDNNGDMIVIPGLPTGGASTASGLLVLGIGTRSNNLFDSGSVVLGANQSNQFSASFNGNTLPNSFIDSGSSVNFLASSGKVPLTICGSHPNFICPGSSITLTANNTGTQGTSGSANVLIVDAQQSFTNQPGFSAVPGLSYALTGPVAEMDLGASFFYGRVISTLIENQVATGMAVVGPAFGYTP